jgi:hypothetical protein
VNVKLKITNGDVIAVMSLAAGKAFAASVSNIIKARENCPRAISRITWKRRMTVQ